VRVPPLWISAGGLLGLAALIGGALSCAPRPAATPPEAPHPIEAVGRQWLRPVGTEEAYAGNESCRPCHEAEFAGHAETPHARTLHPVRPGDVRPEFSRGATVVDQQNGLTYSVQAGGAGTLVARSAGREERGSPAWVFGSGTHAWTYLGAAGDSFTELRLSYYPPTREWNFTPGQGPANPLGVLLGQTYSPVGAAACFGCHSTVLVGGDAGLELGKSVLNVGCESCHGPGRAHVESATRGGGPLVRPAHPEGSDQMKVCGACHRTPTVGEPNAMMESQLARFAGPALMRSRCYLESDGRLTCTTCHDPHRPASRSAAFYDAKCGSCHQPPTGNPCTAGRRADCVSCHMPRQKIARKLPLLFHNHWIRKELPPEEQIMKELAAAAAEAR
jgi:hypothetical protein